MTDNIDASSKEPFSDKQLHQAILDEQSLIANELQANQDVTPLSYNPKATVLHIPKYEGNAAFTITLASYHCKTRQLIFGVFNACKYRYFSSDEFPESRKKWLKFCRDVWRYLDTIDLIDEKRATWLKDYEAWRVIENGVKTHSTGLEKIKLMIENALSFGAFNSIITDFEREYLVTLAKTSAAPRDEPDAVNLNQWFSQHTWLRRDDIGIGHELYTRLSSPKSLMNSFRITIETTLLYLQTCKDALIDSFKLAGVTPAEIPDLAKITVGNNWRKQIKIKTEIFDGLRQKLALLLDDIPHLRNALELVVLTEVKSQYRKLIYDKLLENQPILFTTDNAPKGFFTSKLETGLFDIGFLRQLAFHAVSSPENDIMPVSLSESLLFSYLMAYQTVQTSDIPKLTLHNFKFVKRINGAITHIESDYFKGRAKNNVHQVETLMTKNQIGRAVLRYLKDVTALSEQGKPLTPVIPKDRVGPASKSGLMYLACVDTALSHAINQKHQTQMVAPVFPKAVRAMLYNGVNCRSNQRDNPPRKCIVSEKFFHFSHIKTSAVYARSDNFDPSILVNLRSHTNDTERKSYLVEMNQEWQNICGRVTRAVMRDLYVNVFKASVSDKQLFESEFTKAVEHIKARSDDVLACLKIVTEQTSGCIDELVLLSKGAQIDGDLPDTIYIQDSPETVLKLKHFLAQLQEKHTLLRDCAPEYLFFTALPTAEWIESLFDNKRFSKVSLEKGQVMYDQYQSYLPPHFTAQL